MQNTDRQPRAFTLTELLVVVAIIVLLLGTLFVAINAASKRAQVAKTQFLMNTISSGLAQFNTDFGYYPPVLGVRLPISGAAAAGTPGFARDLMRLSDVSGQSDVARQQSWFSYTTLAEYLIGYGHRGEDGYGRPAAGASGNPPAGPGDKESPRYGIRSPGTDGCWGAWDLAPQGPPADPDQKRGVHRYRNPSRSTTYVPIGGSAAVNVPGTSGSSDWNKVTTIEGRVYGPYIDSIDERLLGGLTGFDASGRPIIVTNDQIGPGSTVNFEALPKCLLDYWGEPIAYYRAPHAAADLRSSVPSSGGGFLNLGDVYCLREWEIDTAEQSAGAVDANGDNSSSAALKGASFAIFSRGADRSFDRSVRRDGAELNKDNVVQVGK